MLRFAVVVLAMSPIGALAESFALPWEPQTVNLESPAPASEPTWRQAPSAFVEAGGRAAFRRDFIRDGAPRPPDAAADAQELPWNFGD